MGKTKKRYNWKSRQVVKAEIDKSEEKKVIFCYSHLIVVKTWRENVFTLFGRFWWTFLQLGTMMKLIHLSYLLKREKLNWKHQKLRLSVCYLKRNARSLKKLLNEKRKRKM